MSNVKLTIYDVARVAGVSRSTVSRVMNDVPGASQQIRTRVLTVAAQLGYRPSGVARALATGRTRTIDLIAVTHGPPSGWLGVHPHYSRTACYSNWYSARSSGRDCARTVRTVQITSEPAPTRLTRPR